jgi:hypothetical protein
MLEGRQFAVIRRFDRGTTLPMAKATKAVSAAPTAPAPLGTVFNVLQFVALGALIASVAMLWLALQDYGFKITGN